MADNPPEKNPRKAVFLCNTLDVVCFLSDAPTVLAPQGVPQWLGPAAAQCGQYRHMHAWATETTSLTAGQLEASGCHLLLWLLV